MTKLLLVEDHPIYAEALLKVMEQREDLEVVMVVDTAEKALQVIPELTLDLILIDISLPTMNGMDLVGMLNHLYPDLPCLMISGHKSSFYLNRCLAAGARGYVVKDNAKEILEGIDRVMKGEIYICEELRTL